MHDWEVLAMEERTVRRDLDEKASDMEEQLSATKAVLEKAMIDRDQQSNAVDGLQNALREIQTARKKELREIVETSKDETDTLRKQLEDLRGESLASKTELESAKFELERALPFEKEVKEKNLLIGKLKHEAVILSDHLTKALRSIKRGKAEDTIDRYVLLVVRLGLIANIRAVRSLPTIFFTSSRWTGLILRSSRFSS